MSRPYKSLLPGVGERTVRSRLEELFDRKSTTGFMLGAMIGGFTTTLVSAIAPGGLALFSAATGIRLLLWFVGVLCTVALAVYWERVAETADEMANKAEEVVSEDE